MILIWLRKQLSHAYQGLLGNVYWAQLLTWNQGETTMPSDSGILEEKKDFWDKIEIISIILKYIFF